MPALSSLSAPTAATAVGIFCRFCSRRSAVTTTSARVPAWVALAAMARPPPPASTAAPMTASDVERNKSHLDSLI